MQIKHGSPRIGDVKRNFSDTSKAARMLGWKVKTELEDGIEKTIDYFMQA
jgi:UDP-glucose 4-epimerase